MKQNFVQFRDLKPELVNVELQVHTTWTDGRSTIAEQLESARQRGLATIAFTEHVRRDTDWFAGFAAAVREEARRFPELMVLVGCEAKALDSRGTLDASEETLAFCDIVLGSVHRFPDGRGGLLNFAALDAGATAEIECELALGLLRGAPIDVLAHPAGMYQRRYGRYPDTLFRRMLEASVERGIAVEINTSYLVNMEPILELCHVVNPFVSIGSDAHGAEEVGRCRDALLRSRIFAS
jgi:putative hydrolase